MNSSDAYERKVRAVASNKRVRHDYEIMQTIEAGIILQGTEVKSLRQGKCSLQDAYAAFPDKYSEEFFLMNFHIAHYEQGNINNHVEKRARKLLVNHREAVKLHSMVMEKGLTILPLSVYFSGAFIKVELAVVRAKRKYDKRESVKERETERDLKRKYAL